MQVGSRTLWLLGPLVVAWLAASPAASGETAVSAFQMPLNQSVKDRDGAEIGKLVDILVTPRSGQLVAVIQQPASDFPLAVPYSDLSFSGGGAFVASSAKEFGDLPKTKIITGEGIPSKRFGRLPLNTGLLATASVPAQELSYPALPNQAEPYMRAQTNLDTLWKQAIKPLQ